MENNSIREFTCNDCHEVTKVDWSKVRPDLDDGTSNIYIQPDGNDYKYVGECENCGNLVEIEPPVPELVVDNVDVDKNGMFIQITDEVTNRSCWIEAWKSADNDDWDWDFNQYIFHLDDDSDVIAKMFQEDLGNYGEELGGLVLDTIYEHEDEYNKLQENKAPTMRDRLKEAKSKKEEDEDKTVKVMAYGKIYYEFSEDEWEAMSEEDKDITIVDTADQATEEEGHTVEEDEVEIVYDTAEEDNKIKDIENKMSKIDVRNKSNEEINNLVVDTAKTAQIDKEDNEYVMYIGRFINEHTDDEGPYEFVYEYIAVLPENYDDFYMYMRGEDGFTTDNIWKDDLVGLTDETAQKVKDILISRIKEVKTESKSEADIDKIFSKYAEEPVTVKNLKSKWASASDEMHGVYAGGWTAIITGDDFKIKVNNSLKISGFKISGDNLEKAEKVAYKIYFKSAQIGYETGLYTKNNKVKTESKENLDINSNNVYKNVKVTFGCDDCDHKEDYSFDNISEKELAELEASDSNTLVGDCPKCNSKYYNMKDYNIIEENKEVKTEALHADQKEKLADGTTRIKLVDDGHEQWFIVKSVKDNGVIDYDYDYDVEQSDEDRDYFDCSVDVNDVEEILLKVMKESKEVKTENEEAETIGDLLEEIEDATSISEIEAIGKRFKNEFDRKIINDEIASIETEYQAEYDIYDLDEDSDEYIDILNELKSCIASDFSGEENNLNESKDLKIDRTWDITVQSIDGIIEDINDEMDELHNKIHKIYGKYKTSKEADKDEELSLLMEQLGNLIHKLNKIKDIYNKALQDVSAIMNKEEENKEVKTESEKKEIADLEKSIKEDEDDIDENNKKDRNYYDKIDRLRQDKDLLNKLRSKKNLTEDTTSSEFNLYIKPEELSDVNISSLLFDSDTVIADYKEGNYLLSLIVRGSIKIYDNETGYAYKNYQDFPVELQNLIRAGALGSGDDTNKYTVDMNNWFEWFLDEVEDNAADTLWYDVADIEGMLNKSTPEENETELEIIMKDIFNDIVGQLDESKKIEAKFKDKVKAIKKSLKKNDKRLSDETAEKSAEKIAGSMIKKEEKDIEHLKGDLEINLEDLLLNHRYSNIDEIKKALESDGIKVNSLAEDGPKDEDDTTDLSLVGNVEYTMGFDIELFYITTRTGDMYITECNVLEQYDECRKVTESKTADMDTVDIVMELEGGELTIEDVDDWNKVKSVADSLKGSQGFYGRLLRSMLEAEEEFGGIENLPFPITM